MWDERTYSSVIVLGERPRTSSCPSILLRFFTGMPSTQPRVVSWTPEEDQRLASAVASCESSPARAWLPLTGEPSGGPKICWKKVAVSMPGTFARPLCRTCSLISLSSGRNNKSCRKRWLHSLDPKLRKGRIRPLHVSPSSSCPV